MFKHTKIVATCLLVASASASAVEYPAPIHSAKEVLSAVLKQAKVDQNRVKVVVLRYDYLERMWHVALAPTDRACIDCMPSFFVKDRTPIAVVTVPNG